MYRNVSTYIILARILVEYFFVYVYHSKNGKTEKGSLNVVEVILNEIDAYFCQLKNKICTNTFDIFGVCMYIFCSKQKYTKIFKTRK